MTTTERDLLFSGEFASPYADVIREEPRGSGAATWISEASIVASPGEPPGTVDFREIHLGMHTFDERSKTILSKIASIVGINEEQAWRGLVQESSASTTFNMPDGGTETWGVSVRLVVATSKLDVNVDVTVPAVAAAVQLNLGRANAAIDVRGYKGDLSASLPRPASLNVESYASFISAFGEIQQKVMADRADWVPTLLTRDHPSQTYAHIG